jgi:hypothetical protein
MSYVSNSGSRTGQTFIFPDGTQRVISGIDFHQAKLMNKATMLKFYYSFCEIEVSGERLNIIFDDITNGRMFTLSKDDDGIERYFSKPVTTNIIHFPKTSKSNVKVNIISELPCSYMPYCKTAQSMIFARCILGNGYSHFQKHASASCVHAVLCRVNPARQNSAERRFAKIRKNLSGMVSGGNVYPTHSPRIPYLTRRNTSYKILRFCMLRKKRPQSVHKASVNRRFIDASLSLRCRFVVASLTLCCCFVVASLGL